MNRRHGRFSLYGEDVDSCSPYVTRVMGSCSILRAEYHFYSHKVEYVAKSFRFRELSEGEMIPEYVWIFTAEGDMRCEEVK